MLHTLPGFLALSLLLGACGSEAQPRSAEPGDTGPLEQHVVSIAAGEQHSVAVLTDGSVWTWGLSGNGQLGREVTIDDYWLPRRVPGVNGAFAAAGGSSSFVYDGESLWTTGYNADGRLGWGPTRDEQRFSARPHSRFVDLESWGPTTYALRSDSTVLAWGEGGSGQLGTGTTPLHQVDPVAVDLDKPVVAIAAGGAFAIVAHDDGTVSTWGHNVYGALGVPHVPNLQAAVTASGAASASSSASARKLFSESPVQPQIGDVVGVAAGGSHALVVRSDSTVWGWGSNEYGALGHPDHDAILPEPVQIQGLSGVVAVAAGHTFSLALKADGSVWIWGFSPGPLSDGGAFERVRQVPRIAGITHIEAGQTHAFAVSSNGDLWGWGLADQGQVGSEESEGETDWPPLRVRFRTP
ncbi:MAG: hypothetical protein Rubg2KO_14630 [Rubricoccaceae bacterium]